MTNKRMTPPATDVEATLVDPQAIADLMQALERIFRAGVFYPAGHVLCDQAAEYFFNALGRIVGKARALIFEVRRETLTVQGLDLDSEMRGVAGFLELLVNLGISRIEIGVGISAAEMHAFVTRLLAYRNEIQNARSFKQIELPEMPSMVRVKSREFLSAEIDSSEDSSQPSIEVLLASLARQGLTKEQISRYRSLLEAIPVDPEEKKTTEGGLYHVTRAEVEKLLIRSQDRDESARQAIDLLPAGQSRPEDHAQPVMTLEELRAALAACTAGGYESVDLVSTDRREDLSILMSMLQRDQKLQMQERIEFLLRNTLSTSLEPGEWWILVEGVRHLVDMKDEERLSGAVTMMCKALYRFEHAQPLTFLLDVCRERPAGDLSTMWPFLVNEILMAGRRAAPRVFTEACELAASISSADMEAGMARLKHLFALRENRISKDLFMPPPSALYPVFATILNSSQAADLGERLLRGLRHTPPGWLGEAIVPLLGRFRPYHCRFLSELMQETNRSCPSPTLAKSAARILAEALPALPREERRNSWVPKSIRAVARLPVANAESLLRRIAHERRLLLLPDWPSPCRAAARETLREIRSRMG